MFHRRDTEKNQLDRINKIFRIYRINSGNIPFRSLAATEDIVTKEILLEGIEKVREASDFRPEPLRKVS
jgi:hypothetical protein